MQNRKGAQVPGVAPRCGLHRPIFHLLSSVFSLSVLLAGCAAPGDPIERKPAVTTPVTDLVAVQSGNAVSLAFTLPKETALHRPLKAPPTIELFRDFLPPAQQGSAVQAHPNPTLLVTIPSELVAQYTSQGRFRYLDSLTAEDFLRHGGSDVVYIVRTRISKKKDSEDSNPAPVRVFPVPDPIADLKGEVTHEAIVLSWTAPEKSPVGPVPAVLRYDIYRAEMTPAGLSPVENENPKKKSQLAKIGEADSATFRDSLFEFGKTYVYSVRSAVQVPGGAVESADSNLLSISPKDVFPPSAPQGLVIIFVPASAGVPAHLELSWAINPETDIAGYNVYRSEQEGSRGDRLNADLLISPAFRDMNAVPGRRYFYSVTAVDRAGNESSAGAPQSASVPGESPAQ